MNDDDIDAVLRNALAPTAAAASRVASAALAGPRIVGRRRLLPAAAGAVAAALLLVALAVVLRPISPPKARTSTVYSVGELVVGVSPSGSYWIVGPGDHLDPPAVPRIVVVKGGSR